MDIESRNKARRVTNERNLAGLANDTKWSELFGEIHSMGLMIEVKFIDSENISEPTRIWIPASNYIEGMAVAPELFCFVEWVRSSSNEALATLAEKVGLVYETNSDTTTVYGYK
jgi:hypothetical protein